MSIGLKKYLPAAFLVAGLLFPTALTMAQMPPAITVRGEKPVATFHAEGAQVYECKRASGNKLIWQLREPVAALMAQGSTIGLHYAGPSWQQSTEVRCRQSW